MEEMMIWIDEKLKKILSSSPQNKVLKLGKQSIFQIQLINFKPLPFYRVEHTQKPFENKNYMDSISEWKKNIYIFKLFFREIYFRVFPETWNRKHDGC